ncbi:MAG: DUF1073 domain-containing protein [Pseudomonadota bacterium]|nr:DUF1073 domain-containing protein [Pseudomonadota bacterium]
MAVNSGVDNGASAYLSTTNGLSSSLLDLLVADEIVPGTDPSYQICKIIYSYHPLGAKMAESPIGMAQSQERDISIPGAPEDDLKLAFRNEWDKTGVIGADVIIYNLMKTSRIYGIASLVAGVKDFPTNEPLPWDRLHEADMYYNIIDPLNSAGSLVLNQDPNAPDFQKPTYLKVASKDYHPSRAVIMMNEQPIYIQWSNSAFGFVGRSVYQRALFPLKSFVQSMITDDAVTQKAAILVAKLKSPGSIIDSVTRAFYQFKRQSIKGAKTGNVLSIGTDENIESIDLKNIRDAAEFARENILKNIATSANMPASMLNQETLAEGFGEGSEDAKQIARYIDRLRIEMGPAYQFMDDIVMRRAWNADYYKTIQRRYPGQYGKVPYETAFYQWKNAFKATWPNLLKEPDSELVKVDDIIMKAAIGTVEVLAPMLDPSNKATLAVWLADVMNDRKMMFSSPLLLDEEAIAQYVPPEPEKEPEVPPEAYET